MHVLCFRIESRWKFQVCFVTNKNDVSLNLFLYIGPHSSECEIVVWIPCLFVLFVSVFLSRVRCCPLLCSWPGVNTGMVTLQCVLALYECYFSPFYHSLCSLLLRCSPLGLPGCWMRISTNNPSLIWLVMCMLLN